MKRITTNIVENGITYELVVTVEDDQFRGKGTLAGARDGTVLWLGKDGEVEVVRAPGP